jgi:predicted  nucleic acid-binding Zn-ribbon protein
LILERNQFDFKVRELTSQIETIQTDRIRLTHETVNDVELRKKLESEKGTLEKDLARLEARFEASIQHLKDREEVITYMYM